ncbi:MAG: DUF748 domain-containing protein [Candidatus Omnitrophota bacterium]
MERKNEYYKKTLKIIAKVILGIFLFYLCLSLVLIPLICPWLIKSQVSKLISHKVIVCSVKFNPFLLRLSVKGLEILDSNKQIIVGFDKFWLDISFISLLQKKYHIESLGINGLKVNIVLSGEGNINLLELVPKQTEKSQSQQPAPAQNGNIPEAGTDKSLPLPLVRVDSISMNKGSICFIDKSVNPDFVTALSNMTLRIVNLSTSPDAQAKVSFQAKIDDQGTITDETLIKPFAIPFSFETVFKLNDYVLQVLTPYVGKYTGHAAKSGKLNITMEYRIEDNKLDAKHKILVQGFDFGDKVESKDALNLPFGLALALLEDSQNRINISLPVDGDMNSPDFHYFKLVGQVARNFFFKIVTKPFSFLVSLVGSENSAEEFGYVNFLPGGTDLSDGEKEKLKLIVSALKERPNLTLVVKECYDPVADWRAIKTEVFENNFLLMRKESKRSDNWIYEQIYEHRFGAFALRKLIKAYRLKAGGYDFNKINQEIKRQMIEDGAADKSALKALAAERAKAADDFIIAQGFEPKRISIGLVQENQASAGFVPLELELKVFDNLADTPTDSLLPAEVRQ